MIEPYFYDGVTEEMLAKTVDVSFGENELTRDCRPVLGGTLGQLVDALEIKHGPKSGRYLLPGKLAVNAQGISERAAKYVEYNSLMMFDIDTGYSFGDIDAALEKAGLFAIVWATHSHNSTQTYVSTTKLSAFLRKKEGKPYAGGSSHEKVRAFLAINRRINPVLLEGPEFVVPEFSEMYPGEGEAYLVKHAPMAKYRVVFVLDEPFKFVGVPGKTHTERVRDWKEAYERVGKSLGFVYDVSCVDPARLMFLPRAAKGKVLGEEGGHEVVVVSGDWLKLEEAVGVGSALAVSDDPIAQFQAAVGSSGSGTGVGGDDAWKPVTPDLMRFLAEVKSDFDIVSWLYDVMPEEEIRKGGSEDDLIEVTCPNEESHTGGRREIGSPMFAWRAGDGSESWGLSCRTDGCTQEFGGDRAKALDAFIQGWKHYPPGDAEPVELVSRTAMELITPEWAPETYKRLDVELELQGVRVRNDVDEMFIYLDDFASTVSRETKNTPVPDVVYLVNVIEKVARSGSGGVPEAEKIALELQTKLGGYDLWPFYKIEKLIMLPVRRAIRNVKKELKDAVGGNAAERLAETGEGVDGTIAGEVWWHWNLTDKKRVMMERFCAMNSRDPRVFAWQSVVGKLSGENYRLEEMTVDTFRPHLGKFVKFHKVEMKEEREVSPFVQEVRDMFFSDDFREELPVLEKVVRVPVFNAVGELLVANGYDVESKTYLAADMDYIEVVDDEVTEEAAYEALWTLLEGPLRDFPFSDKFSGVDLTPQYLAGGGDEDVETIDGREYPRVNFDRGASSRVNFVALLLQHFARELIRGPTPLFHLDKSVPGTGANYLANVFGVITEGKEATPSTLAPREEEVTKTLTALLLSGGGLVFFDNVNGKVDSSSLAKVVTSGMLKDRVLGSSLSPELKVSNSWLTAGNNVSFSDELVRRIVPVRLDAAMANPIDRKTFVIDNLSRHLREHRAEYVHCLHVMIAWWVKSGKPNWSLGRERKINSFEEWSYVVGGILECADDLVGRDFLGNLDAFKKMGYVERGEDTVVLDIIHEANGYNKASLEAISMALNEDERVELNIRGGGAGSVQQSLKRATTYRLKKLLNRVLQLSNGESVTLERSSDGHLVYYQIVKST